MWAVERLGTIGMGLALAIVAAGPAEAFTIKNDASSDQSIVVVGHKFTSPAAWRGRLRKCDRKKGQFMDPRDGGECWSCPKNYKRTVFPVHKGKACQKKGNVLGGWSKATKINNKCPRGSFQNGVYNQCYSCPKGFRRSAKIGVDLTKMNDACIANSYVYKSLKAGKSEGFSHKNPVYNVKGAPTTTLYFSVYSASRKCGWHSAPKKAGKTPGLSPTQKACHLVSFAMKANETAVVRAGPISTAAIHTSKGKRYKNYCNPPQPPNHSTGVSCSRSEAQVGQYQF